VALSGVALRTEIEIEIGVVEGGAIVMLRERCFLSG
jgi:hypothetical protein